MHRRPDDIQTTNTLKLRETLRPIYIYIVYLQPAAFRKIKSARKLFDFGRLLGGKTHRETDRHATFDEQRTQNEYREEEMDAMNHACATRTEIKLNRQLAEQSQCGTIRNKLELAVEGVEDANSGAFPRRAIIVIDVGASA